MLSVPAKTRQFLRFCTVGASNTAVDFAAFFLLTQGGATPLLAQPLAYAAGMANSFFWNRRWTFRRHQPADIMEIAKFAAVNGLTLLLTSSLLFLFHDISQLALWPSKLAATGAGFALNYLGSRLWVFTNREATA